MAATESDLYLKVRKIRMTLSQMSWKYAVVGELLLILINLASIWLIEAESYILPSKD